MDITTAKVVTTGADSGTSTSTSSSTAATHVVQGALELQVSASSTIDSLIAKDSFKVTLADAVAAGLGASVSPADVKILSVNVKGERRLQLRGARRVTETANIEVSFSVTLADASKAAEVMQVLSDETAKDEFKKRFKEVLEADQPITVLSIKVKDASLGTTAAAATPKEELDDAPPKEAVIAGGLSAMVVICIVWICLRKKCDSYRVFSSIVPGDERKVDLNRRAAKRMAELKEEQMRQGGS